MFFDCCWVACTLSQGLFWGLMLCQWGSAQKAGRKHGGTADSNWPERYSTPQIMPHTEIGGATQKWGPLAAQGQPGHQSADGEQLCCESLVFLGFSSFLSLPLLLLYFTLFWLLTVIISTHDFYFFLFLILLPIPQGWGGVRKQLCDAWLPAGVKPWLWQTSVTIEHTDLRRAWEGTRISYYLSVQGFILIIYHHH